MTQATLSAGQSGIGYQKARDIGAPAHLGYLMAAKPRTQAMIQDEVWAGLPTGHLLETRLTAVIETATSTYLSALDEDQATAKKKSRRQLRQQTKLGGTQLEDCSDMALPTRPSHPLNIPAPGLKMKTVMKWTSPAEAPTQCTAAQSAAFTAN